MNPKLLGILSFAGIVIGILATGFFLGKILNKAAKKKYQREFKLMCYAVAKEISARTKCDIEKLRWQICDYVDMCAKYDDIPKDPGIHEYYKLKDYRHFSYICAIKYASQYRFDDSERTSIEQYCSFKLPDFSNYSFYESYDNRADINRVPKNNPYLLALFLWIIGIPFCRLTFSIWQLIVAIISKVFD